MLSARCQACNIITSRKSTIKLAIMEVNGGTEPAEAAILVEYMKKFPEAKGNMIGYVMLGDCKDYSELVSLHFTTTNAMM